MTQTPKRIDTHSLDSDAKRTVEEFVQFLRWFGPPDAEPSQFPLRHLAAYWYNGLITIKEGKLIEEGRTLR